MITASCPLGGPARICSNPIGIYAGMDDLLSQEQTFLWKRTIDLNHRTESRFIKEYPKDVNLLSNYRGVKREGSITFGFHSDREIVVVPTDTGWGYGVTDDAGQKHYYIPFDSSGQFDRPDYFGKGFDLYCKTILGEENKKLETIFTRYFKWTIVYYFRDNTESLYSWEAVCYTIIARKDQSSIGFAYKSFSSFNPPGEMMELSDLMKMVDDLAKDVNSYYDYDEYDYFQFGYNLADPPHTLETNPVPYSIRLEQYLRTFPWMLDDSLPTIEDMDEALVFDAVVEGRPDTSNWLETAIGSKALLPSIVTSISKVRGGILGTIQRFAGSYLFWLYGLRPIPSDLKNLSNAISIARGLKNYPEWSFSKTSEFKSGGYSGTQSAFVRCRGINRDPLSIDSIDSLDAPLTAGGYLQIGRRVDIAINKLSDAGIPTDIPSLLSMFWDLLPYSFVIDWFVQIGNRLDLLSSKKYYDRLPILYVRRTIVATRDESDVLVLYAEICGLDAPSVSVTSEFYMRFYSAAPDVPTLKARSATVSTHWLELGAIVVLRLK